MLKCKKAIIRQQQGSIKFNNDLPFLSMNILPARAELSFSSLEELYPDAEMQRRMSAAKWWQVEHVNSDRSEWLLLD